MLNSLKLYTLIILIAFTLARKNRKNLNKSKSTYDKKSAKSTYDKKSAKLTYDKKSAKTTYSTNIQNTVYSEVPYTPKIYCQQPTGCSDCANNQECKISTDRSDTCPSAKCVPFEGCVKCTERLPQCDNCADDERCEVMPQTCFSCARAVCFGNNKPCASCRPKSTCDSCAVGQICVIESPGPCECPEPKCVTPPADLS